MIGERIRQLRGTESQLQWETRFGVTRNTIRRYETGKNPPDADFIVALCRAYNVSADWLLLGKEEKKQNGAQLNNFEDPLIKELKLWLREMTGEYPGWRTWFETELLRKVPEFAEWRKKNQQGHPDQTSATG